MGPKLSGQLAKQLVDFHENEEGQESVQQTERK